MGFDELSMTSVKSKDLIEGLNHMITIPRGSYFHSTGLPLHTAKCYWWIVGPTSTILMIDDSRWAVLELFQSIEKSFDDIMIKIIMCLITR